MAGRCYRLDAQIAHQQQVAIVKSKIDKRRWTEMAHHHFGVKRLADFPRRRKMVGMGVSVDCIAQRQTMLAGKAAIALDGADLWIDHGANAAFGATDEIRSTAADLDCL